MTSDYLAGEDTDCLKRETPGTKRLFAAGFAAETRSLEQVPGKHGKGS